MNIELTSVCGGIPRLYLYGGETALERLALQNICMEKARQPSRLERQKIRIAVGRNPGGVGEGGNP